MVCDIFHTPLFNGKRNEKDCSFTIHSIKTKQGIGGLTWENNIVISQKQLESSFKKVWLRYLLIKTSLQVLSTIWKDLSLWSHLPYF